MRFSLPPPVLSLLSKCAPLGALWDIFHNICAMLISDGSYDRKARSAKTDRGLKRGLVLLVVKYVTEAKKKKKSHDGNKVPGRQMTKRSSGLGAPATHTHAHRGHKHTHTRSNTNFLIQEFGCFSVTSAICFCLLHFGLPKKPKCHLSICVTAQVVAASLWLSFPQGP